MAVFKPYERGKPAIIHMILSVSLLEFFRNSCPGVALDGRCLRKDSRPEAIGVSYPDQIEQPNSKSFSLDTPADFPVSYPKLREGIQYSSYVLTMFTLMARPHTLMEPKEFLPAKYELPHNSGCKALSSCKRLPEEKKRGFFSRLKWSMTLQGTGQGP